jgi:hexokinase
MYYKPNVLQTLLAGWLTGWSKKKKENKKSRTFFFPCNFQQLADSHRRRWAKELKSTERERKKVRMIFALGLTANRR